MNETAFPVDPDELAAHTDRLRALVCQLVADPGRVDDLVQETQLIALTHVRRRDVPLRAWLVGVARNLVRRDRRTTARRERREAFAARPIGVPAAGDLVERAEFIRVLVAQVVALDEPYREALLLRFVEGLEPHKIAARTGVPRGTVRSRLNRGLELVRARLDARHGGDRRKWMSLCLPFVRAGRGTGRITAGSAASIFGGVLMAKKVVVACAILALLLIAGWFAAGRFASRAEPANDVADAGIPAEIPPAPARSRTRVAPASEAPTTATAAATPSAREAFPPPSPSGTLVVRVVWEDDGLPAAGLWVRVHPWDSPDPFLYMLRERTDHDGTAVFPAVHVGRAGVYVETGGAPVATIDADSRREVVVRVPKGHAIEGTVVNAKGAPVADAVVYERGLEVATTGADGTFRLRTDANGAQLGARAAGHAPSGYYAVTGAIGAVTHLRIVLPDGGGSVTGRVLDPEGHPLAHARVRVGPWNYARCVTLDDGSALRVQDVFETTTDAEGRYRVDGIETVKTVVHARAPHFAPGGAEADVTAGKTAEVDVVLHLGGSVVGTVKDAAGVAIRDAVVLAGPYGDFLSAQCHTDAEGHYRLDGLTPCDVYPVTAEAEGKGKAEASIPVRAGAEAAWDPVLSGGTVTTGRVLDGSGQPRAKWLLQMSCMQPGLGWSGSAVTDADGRFSVPNCPNDLLRIEVMAAASGGEWPQYASAVRTDVRPGGAGIDITVDDRDLPTAFVMGTVLGADGRPAEGVEVRVRHPEQRMTPYHFADAGTGRFRIGPLPPAAYDVTIVAKGHPDVRLGAKDVQPNSELDLGTILLGEGGVLEVKAKRDGGAAATRIWGEVFAEDGKSAGYLTGDGDVARCPSLPPGRYGVRVNETVSPTEAWMALLSVEIRAGQKTSIDATLAAAGLRMFRAVLATGGAPTANVRVVVRTTGGAIVYDMTTPLTANLAVSLAFPAGSYVADASTPDGLRADARFEVAGAGSSKEVVNLILR